MIDRHHPPDHRRVAERGEGGEAEAARGPARHFVRTFRARAVHEDDFFARDPGFPDRHAQLETEPGVIRPRP